MNAVPKTRPEGPSVTDFDHLPAVLTTREAANALRIGIKELRKLVDAGQIPAARFGPRRLIRISRSALLATLSGRSA
jgi:excisionase family DNA binding protein